MAGTTAPFLGGNETDYSGILHKVDYIAEVGGQGATSLKLMPDMTDKNINDVFKNKLPGYEGLPGFDGIPLAQLTDRQQEARKRVVAATVKSLSSGKLDSTGEEGQLVRAAIEHQLKADGAPAADSLATDISKGLPNGMKLTIKSDSDFEQRVRKFCEDNGYAMPTYIRVVQLSDRDGKLLGQIGITGDANANKKLSTDVGI